MHASVRNYFVKFNEKIEGRVAHMYLDKKGLVTIGIGNLFDVENPGDTVNLTKVMGELVTLPFVYKEKHRNAGMPATKADIEAEWKKVKKMQEFVNYTKAKFADGTDLRLKPKTNDAKDVIDAMVLKKADAMEKELKMDPAYWDFEQWPADGQLGLLSMSWALGATRIRNGWPNFKAACKKQDFDGAVKHCHILDANNPGVTPRNADNKHLFKNAAAVLVNDGSNPAQNRQERITLHYPHWMMKKVTIRG